MPAAVRKTVVIGIGGTGIRCALEMKKSFIENYGSVPEVVQLFCLDTKNYRDEKALPRTRAGEIVDLVDAKEWLHARVDNPMHLLDADYLAVDFPKGQITNEALINGAHCIRACGRLAALAHATTIRTRIQDAIRLAKSFRSYDETMADEEIEVATSTNVRVYIVCSLGGGTGSGAFLDVAYICKELLDPMQDQLNGIFLLPQIFRIGAYTAPDNLEGNTYAAVRELDYLMTRGGRGESAPDYVKYDDGAFRIDWAANAPFNRVFFVDAENEEGNFALGIEEMQEFIGRGLFISTGVAAGTAQSIFDNEPPGVETDTKKAHRYTGIGCATIELPRESIFQHATLSKISATINGGFLTGDPLDLRANVRAFLSEDDVNLDEESDDPIIDHFIPKACSYPHPESPQPWLDKFPEKEIESWRASQENAIENFFGEELARKVEYSGTEMDKIKAFRLSSRLSIDEKIQALLAEGKGIPFALSFVEGLVDELRADCRMLRDEITKSEQKLVAPESKLLAGEALKKRCRGMFPKGRIEEIMSNLNSYLTQYEETYKEVLRRKRAISAIENLVQYVSKLADPLRTLEGNLRSVMGEVNRRARDLEMSTPKSSFVSRLPIGCLEKVIEEKNEGFTDATVLGLIDGGGDHFLDWAELDEEAILARLTKPVQSRYSSILDTKIEAVLSSIGEKSETELTSLLTTSLISRSKPMWKLVSQQLKHKTREIFLIGVENSLATMFRGKYSLDKILPSASFDLVTTHSSRELSAFRYRFYVEANEIRCLSSYRDLYEYVESESSQTHHIRNRWARSAEALPSIEAPRVVKASNEQLMMWVLGSSGVFDRIVRHGQFWHIRSDDTGRLEKLAQGRIQAFEAFVQQAESGRFMAEIESAIEKQYLALREEDVTRHLVEHFHFLVKEERNAASSALSTHIQREWETLQAYLKDTHRIEVKPEPVNLEPSSGESGEAGSSAGSERSAPEGG